MFIGGNWRIAIQGETGGYNWTKFAQAPGLDVSFSDTESAYIHQKWSILAF